MEEGADGTSSQLVPRDVAREKTELFRDRGRLGAAGPSREYPEPSIRLSSAARVASGRGGRRAMYCSL
jgi:hypothetical protein